MKTEIELISPERAKDLLASNTQNRPISKMRVNYYAQLIKEGKWKITHQGIGISNEGIIIDGQHRLLAIVEANKPVWVNVTTGLDSETFKYVDVGYTRTTSNVFATEGITHYTRHSSGIGKYFTFKSRNSSLTYNNNSRVESCLTHDDYLRFYRKNEAFLIYVNKICANLYDHYRIIKISEMYAFIVFCVLDKGWSINVVKSFLESVYGIQNIEGSNAPSILFKRLIQDATGSVKLKPTHKTALIIKAFNFFISRKDVKVLRFNENEQFPEVIQGTG